MEKTVFTDQQQRLIEITIRQLHAIKIGDISFVETQIEEAKEIVRGIKFKWMQHRADSHTKDNALTDSATIDSESADNGPTGNAFADNAPADASPAGASSRGHGVVIRKCDNLVGDYADQGDDATYRGTILVRDQ